MKRNLFFLLLLLVPLCGLFQSLRKSSEGDNGRPTKPEALSMSDEQPTTASPEVTASGSDVTPANPPADDTSIDSELDVAKGEKETLLMCKTPKSMPSQILRRIAYVTSYNYDTKCPNWVAWHLKKEHLNGPYKRNGVPFYDDEGKAYGIGTVTEQTYRSGYFLDMEAGEPRQQLTDWPDNQYHMSHGHLCPAADNKWSKAAMNQTFLLTNICPQTRKLNSGGWNSLENKCRSWADRFGDIYIVAGPVYKGGVVHRRMGESQVAVPDAFFKVVLCKKDPSKAIGFIYPNDDGSYSMTEQCCSVDEVEKITGIDFFASLPDEEENKVESKAVWNDWR